MSEQKMKLSVLVSIKAYFSGINTYRCILTKLTRDE